MLSNLLVAAEESEELRDIGASPYVYGGVALVILVVLLMALLAFGKGREHS